MFCDSSPCNSNATIEVVGDPSGTTQQLVWEQRFVRAIFPKRSQWIYAADKWGRIRVV